MKLSKVLTFITVLIYYVPGFVSAQSARSNLRAADKAFAEGDYYEAAVNYKKVVDEDSSKLDLVYKYAEALRLSNDYSTAERYYKLVMDKDRGQPALFPYSSFWLAMMKKYNGKYVEAKKYFKAYNSKHKKETDYFALKSKYEFNAADAIAAQAKVSENINVVHMDTSVNSNFTEAAPYQLGDSIFYFTSLRNEFQIKDPKQKEEVSTYIAKLYKTTRRGDSVWMNTRELTQMFNAPGFNNSSCVFSTDRKRFYFARSKPTLLNTEGISELYMCEFKQNKWQPAVRLNDPVNASGYITTSPSIAPNGKKGDFLFFASNRPGGKGKFDIWVCTINPEGKISAPSNLGDKINSIDDELTPFFDANTQNLYFSSEWHKSVGGLDIFKSQRDASGTWSEPKSMGFPFNTSYNDLYFTLNANTKDGYFSSNRPGTISNKGETCCNDIYFFEFPEVKQRLDSIRRSEEAAREAVRELDKMTPITLFFDNDAPDPGSTDTVSSLNYETTLRDYVSLRKDFETEYSKGLTGKNKEMAIKEMNDLFDNYISQGMTKLEKFCSLLEKAVVNGRTVNMKVKGFTSPLAMDDYNYTLAKRRVKTLINYIKEYNYSVFQKYMDGTAENGAKLIIIEEAIGESEASKTVSDNPNDQKGAVYSRASSLERKIQITDVIITEAPKKKKS
jgi:tetratricopeptide (TPR) repeat protein